MNNLTVITSIQTKPGKSEVVKAELLKLLDIVKNTDGSLNYILHQDNENKHLFFIYHNWESAQHWREHLKQPYVEAYIEATKGAVKHLKINHMTTFDSDS